MITEVIRLSSRFREFIRFIICEYIYIYFFFFFLKKYLILQLPSMKRALGYIYELLWATFISRCSPFWARSEAQTKSSICHRPNAMIIICLGKIFSGKDKQHFFIIVFLEKIRLGIDFWF